MNFLAVATLMSWLIGLWCALGVFRGGGLLRRLRRLLLAASCAGLGALLAALLIVLHACVAFSGETLVARVTTRRISPEEFELTYTPARSLREPSADRQAAVEPVRLQGDQWALSGGIVKWHPWLTALGLKSYHKPMRLGGQFSNLAQHRAHLPSVYPFEPATDPLWELLYRVDPYLPFIEAVYGSSAYVYVEPHAIQEIYVTPTGYLIKRKAGK